MRSACLALLLLAVALSPAMAASPIDAYRAETEALLKTPDGHYACFPQNARPSQVYVVSTYHGGDQVDPAQPAARAHATRFADVRVAFTGKRVLIVAVAYEPIVWRFDIAPGATVAGVQLFGYHEQFVTGLPADTPVGRVYDANSDGSPVLYCGDPERDKKRKEINGEINNLAGELERASSKYEMLQSQASWYEAFAREWAEIKPAEAVLAQTQAFIGRVKADLEIAKQARLNRMDRLSDAQRSVARLDADGRLPPPFDGWFPINYKQDLSSLAAAIHMFGHFIYADYRFLENTLDYGFVIGEDGVLGPPPTMRETLPDRPVP